MTPIDALMDVIAVLKPSDGWRCVRLTNTHVVMHHATEGERIYDYFDGLLIARADPSQIGC